MRARRFATAVVLGERARGVVPGALTAIFGAMKRSLRRLALATTALVGLAAALSLFGTARAGDPSSGAGGGAGGYAGAASCAPCHRAATKAWETSNHALSTVEAKGGERPPEARTGGKVAHPPGETTFTPVGEGADLVTTGPDGKPAKYPLVYVVGRRRMRMYVTRLDTGALQVLPSMREEGTGLWFDYTHLIFGFPGLKPGEYPKIEPGTPTFWTGPVRSFDARCARCHVSGREPVAPKSDGTGPRSTIRALGVDCEACHGPAADHVALWRSLPKGAVPEPLAKWRDFDREQSLSACLPCHLEGEVVDPSFRPGQDILERIDPTLLDDGERVDPSGRPLELTYEGLALLLSRCAEQGKLTCLDCHAAHGSAHGALLVQPTTDDGLCARCHSALAAAPGQHSHHAAPGVGARCVSCHLPKVPVERGHGAVTDHTISIPNPAGYPGVATAPDACTGCHSEARGWPSGAPHLSPDKIASSFAAWWPRAKARPAWADAIAAARRADGPTWAGLERLLADPAVPRLARASAASLLGRVPGADPAAILAAATSKDSLVRRAAVSALASVRSAEADAALLSALSDPSPAVRARAAKAALEGWERVQANPVLGKAVIPVLAENAAAAPDDDMRWFRLGAARSLAGDLAGAADAYEHECALDPYATSAREALAEIRKRLPKPPK